MASNITKAERIALTGLKKNQNIVIKQFDKGRGVCVMNRSDYLQEGLRQLSGPHYEVVDRDLTGEITAMVYQAVRNLYVDNVTNKETFEFLHPHNHQIKTPSLYLLPKIHKKPLGLTRFA